MKKDFVVLPLGNYYGNVTVFADEGAFYMGIKDNDEFKKNRN